MASGGAGPAAVADAVEVGGALGEVAAGRLELGAEGGQRRGDGVRAGVALGERGADDERVADASAEQVDAFGEAAAEHEKKDAGGGEGAFHPRGLRGEIGEARLERDVDFWIRGGEFALDGFGVGVTREKCGHGASRRGWRSGTGSGKSRRGAGVRRRMERARGGDERGNRGGGGGGVAGALLVGRVHPGVDRDVEGVVAPGRVGADDRGRGEFAGFLGLEEIGGGGELFEEFFGGAFVEGAEAVGGRGCFAGIDAGRSVEADGGGEGVGGRERGGGEDGGVKGAERGADDGGGIEAGDDEFAGARAPPEAREIDCS